MNPFVNPKHRGVQLPKGKKDLIDVLRGNNQAKCEYCRAPADATRDGFPRDYRWCKACYRDLVVFAAGERLEVDFDLNDEAAVSKFHAETQRRQDDFMRQQIKERKGR
ncbi:MAG: hypothetical protein JWM16_3835 [Verrucomicrobiales bacterium]|nr:hypothetical protein [Verrucomicrobiales bacterium]